MYCPKCGSENVEASKGQVTALSLFCAFVLLPLSLLFLDKFETDTYCCNECRAEWKDAR